ncbi:hypothetical protein T4A_2946 [Trichinella pseudospiralis]|uniref:Uncharacterized protein n=1 Tax=Trichinella pseudospiralis TaxID=6337 RepID=A0A0V1EJM0_TRIPS|nr:hypothetical protein T4A_2946 [Trichinella pseudospiralis]KRY88868.1 hypothetical protein T4D_8178 [Trichinella pseudospiralis]
MMIGVCLSRRPWPPTSFADIFEQFLIKRPLVAEASSALKEGRESERKEKDKTKAEEKKKKYVESEF